MSRTSAPALVPLKPVEERFLRTLPGAPQVLATAVVVVDATLLRNAAGDLDRAALLGHLREWWSSDPRMALRLVPSPTGLVPPAWAPSSADPLRAVTVRPQPFRLADLDDVVAQLQLQPVDLSVAPLHVTVLDDPAGPLALVVRGHHAWTDGAFGRTVVERLLSTEPGPLRSPAPSGAAPADPGALLMAWAAPLLLLQQWWSQQPGARAAVRAWAQRPLSGRVRRVLGRHRWALERRRRRAAPPDPRAVRRLELEIGAVRRHARLLGGNINDLLVVATARAVDQHLPAVPAPVQRVLVPLAGPAAGAGRSNQVRVVPVTVDRDRADAECVRSVAGQLRAAPPASAPQRPAPPAHATTMVGPRHLLHLGPAPVLQYALLPSLGEEEDLGVLALVQRRSVVVSVATRRPEAVDAVTDRLRAVLTGAGATGAGAAGAEA